MDGVTSDSAKAAVFECAQRYAAACQNLVAAANACLEVTNRAVGARRKVAEHQNDGLPGTPIAIRNFTSWAEEAEQEFVPLYRAFVEACSVTRDMAANFLSVQTGSDPELVLLTGASDEAYSAAQVARHILLTNYGATPAGFIEGLEQTNAGIQADIFGYGEDGFQGRIYAPPPTSAADEQVCPWCAEAIKAAAIVCRYCGRDVQVTPSAS